MDDKQRHQMHGIVHEAMGDGITIASSAIVLAANRSVELNMNPIITFVIMKRLIQMNIDLQGEEIYKSMESEGYGESIVHKAMHDTMMKRLEETVSGIVDAQKIRKVEVKS